MSPTGQKLKRLIRFLEPKYPVHNRLNLMLFIETHHLLKPILRAVDNPLDRNIPSQRQHVHVRAVLRRIRLSRHIANAVNETTERGGVEALPECLCTASLENDISTVVVCHTHHFVFPVWLRVVVNGIIGTQSLSLFELAVRGRSNDNCCIPLA